jgi:hypothetical protein
MMLKLILRRDCPMAFLDVRLSRLYYAAVCEVGYADCYA